ncbi:MAG: hypothetical protein CUN53_00100 [Phototrophicales bacterium]|nr:MAG: hypothetical protein CUN53_00100 [Phototrophicales bacterium]
MLTPAPGNFSNSPAPSRPEFFSTLPAAGQAAGRPFTSLDWWSRVLARRQAQTLAGLPPSVDVLLPGMPAVITAAAPEAGQAGSNFGAAMRGVQLLALGAGALLLFTVVKRGRG